MQVWGQTPPHFSTPLQPNRFSAHPQEPPMSAHCCDHETPAADKLVDLPRYRRVLWAAWW
jgi:hypothetical protein